MFWIKRAIGMLAQPLPVVFALLALGVLLLWLGKRRKNGIACVALAAAILFVSSFPPLVRWTAGWLENRHPPLAGDEAGLSGHRAIVVLGNGVAHPDDAALPALSRLNDAARARLVEGARLSRRIPDAVLVTTGHGLGLENCADAMALAAMELGVPEERVRRLPQAMDTAHEASLVREMTGDAKVVLVTTAVHMPRAVLLFERSGVKVTAAPCDFIGPASAASREAVDMRRWRPRGGSLADSEEIWHELMGLAYYRFF